MLRGDFNVGRRNEPSGGRVGLQWGSRLPSREASATCRVRPRGAVSRRATRRPTRLRPRRRERTAVDSLDSASRDRGADLELHGPDHRHVVAGDEGVGLALALGGDGARIWKVAAETVGQVSELYAEFEPLWLEEWLPPICYFELEIPRSGGLEVAEPCRFSWASRGSSRSPLREPPPGCSGRLFSAHARAAPISRVVDLVQGPVRLAWTLVLFALGHRSLGLALTFAGTLRWLEGLVFWSWLHRVARLQADRFRAPLSCASARNSAAAIWGSCRSWCPELASPRSVIILFGASWAFWRTLGVNVSAAVAGLGIGGIAIALAAQKTLENLIGGISLFADRPVQVGDFFRYGDQVGTVEEIGLRSTRIRTLDRTVVTIPNAEFSNLRLESFARRDRMRLWTMVGVRYETTPDQLRYLLAQLREILLAHPRVTEEPARVRLVGFGAYSLDLEVSAYVDTSEWNEFLGIREDIYLLFMDAIKEAGTGFAFPSTTTYVGRDEGLNAEEIRQAEARVAQWREKGELPFPNFPDELHREVENSLHWPPPGSPGSST